jgi:hypothetical protein
MATALAIPAELEQAFRQFSRDFARVTAAWIDAGEESPETAASAREGLREYLSITDDPDGYGVARAQRLRDVFAFWRALALSVPVKSVDRGAVPVLSLEAEQRIADREWKRRVG